ncbi:hypothetical protein CHS0354_023845 [Potamilus streckersoni]|uniref:Sigma-54 factor interaction domain-containing protein n=1 Tax=Potamilus streckersoni TaxID=2493646 RepID=A0AAE0RZC6_9BIVA|nr:hypothetical protein CHS0354_023845 [Potamilus streckersoni]
MPTEIIAVSEKIRSALNLAKELAKTNITILILGESGTGKEVFAKFIHENSQRAKMPFIAINCGAIAQSILESELFGHERGSFTGAVATHKGYFEAAHGGTIFLDEVAEMPLETQVKFLRTLESGEFQRVGSSETLRTNARIIAATNNSLEIAVANRKFRADLFFRLRVATILLPPLRERREDIFILTEHFVHEFEKKYQVKFLGFTTEATQELLEHRFSGNIRELRNLVEILVALEHKTLVTPQILKKHLAIPLSFAPTIIEHSQTHPHPHSIDTNSLALLSEMYSDIKDIKVILTETTSDKRLLLPASNTPSATPDTSNPITKTYSFDPEANVLKLAELEQLAIIHALNKTHGNKRQTALKLGITERTLYRKIQHYDIRTDKNSK